MHQHALNPILQRDRARVARPARPAQLEHDIAVLKPAELDIAAVLLNGGPHPRLEQLLDHAHHLAIILVIREAVLVLPTLLLLCIFRPLRLRPRLPGLSLPSSRRGAASNNVHQRLAGRDGLGDERKHLGPDVRPIRVGGFRDRDEVGAVKDGRDPVDAHELGRQRRRVRRRDGAARAEVLDERGSEPFRKHAVVGEELEGVRVGGGFGLDEDGAARGDGEEEGRAG